jgi:hypothetical protein
MDQVLEEPPGEAEEHHHHEHDVAVAVITPAGIYRVRMNSSGSPTPRSSRTR